MTQLEMWKARVWQRRPQPPQEGSSKDDNKKRSRVILEQNLREVWTASHWKNVDSISSGAGAGRVRLAGEVHSPLGEKGQVCLK